MNIIKLKYLSKYIILIGLEDLIRYRNRPLVSEKSTPKTPDAPSCIRSFFEYPTSVEAGRELDKYSFRPSNLKLPSLPSSGLPTETIEISNVSEKDHKMNEVLAKNGKMKEYCQKEDLKDNDTVFPPLSQRGDAFRSINHVGTK